MSRPKAVMHPVKLTATKDASGGYAFSPKSDLWNAPRQEFVFQKDRHGMAKHDYHLVEFALDDRTGDGLRFPKLPHDAMWVTEGDEPERRKCPDVHTASNYSVMEPICVCDDGARLIVRNDNPRKEDWSFTLNFVKGGGEDGDAATYVSWDPGGTNLNGGTGF